VFKEIEFAMEPAFIALTGAEWAGVVVSFRAVDLTFMTLQAGFIPEGFIYARVLVADVGACMLVLVSSI
jgi:hypothetical protein